MTTHTCDTCPACLKVDETNGEVFERLSKSFDGKERQWSKSERYQLFLRGLRDGAAVRALRHPGLGAYELGFAKGRESVAELAAEYAQTIGYEPNILRGDKS